MGKWNNILIREETTILAAIQVINHEGMRAALVVDDNNHLLGMVTDGDIRRSILKNINLNDSVKTIMNCTPKVSQQNVTREQILAQLQTLRIYHLPIVNAENQIVGFETLDSVIASPHKENLVVVMAGGVGKRLHPLTLDCPKPLLKIGNKPVLEILLENFVKCGFNNFRFAVNYKAQMIKDYFGAGEKFGAKIDYLEEENHLGTAGALSLLEKPTQPFFVINADVMTNIDFQCLLQFHEESNVDATLCIREHEQQVPYGVVQRDDITHQLIDIVEKPIRQFYVSAGIYILQPEILSLLSPYHACDMPDLLMKCVAAKLQVGTFPIREYWLDIGQHHDLQQAHNDYEKVFAC